MAIFGPVFGSTGVYSNMQLYFFGDIHSIPKFNYEQDELINKLDKLFNNKNMEYIIDFYIEAPFKPSDIQVKHEFESTNISYLKKIIYFFNLYLYKKLSYSKIRFHYIDIRASYIDPNIKGGAYCIYVSLPGYINNLISRLEFYLREYLKTDKINSNLKNMVEFIKYLIPKFFADGQYNHYNFLKIWATSDNYYYDSFEFADNLIPNNQIENNYLKCYLSNERMVNRNNKIMSRGRAQLYGLGNQDIQNKILEYIFSEQKNINNKNINIFISELEKFYNNPDINNIEKIIRLFKYSCEYFYKMVDLYLLARLFRFNNNNGKIIKIVYAGLSHIDLYNNFFEKLGIKMEQNGTNLKEAEIREFSNIEKKIFFKFD